MSNEYSNPSPKNVTTQLSADMVALPLSLSVTLALGSMRRNDETLSLTIWVSSGEEHPSMVATSMVVRRWKRIIVLV